MADVDAIVEDFLNLDEFSKPSARILEQILLSNEVKLSLQLRALYFCRDLHKEISTRILKSALDIHFDTFMRHEIAYVIGQAGCVEAGSTLAKLLEDQKEDPMVRHEAAEALAALGMKDYIDLLVKYSNDNCAAVRDTCILALHSLSNQECADSVEYDVPAHGSSSCYRVIDPVPCRMEKNKIYSLESLAADLYNESLSIYERYEALLKIRNISGDEAAKIIGRALLMDKKSEVFRHECAFVLGQMQSVSSIGALIACLKNADEEPMARHEAALALGSCGCLCEETAQRDLIIETLVEFSRDAVKVVADSCIVALDNIGEAPASVKK